MTSKSKANIFTLFNSPGDWTQNDRADLQAVSPGASKTEGTPYQWLCSDEGPHRPHGDRLPGDQQVLPGAAPRGDIRPRPQQGEVGRGQHNNEVMLHLLQIRPTDGGTTEAGDRYTRTVPDWPGLYLVLIIFVCEAYPRILMLSASQFVCRNFESNDGKVTGGWQEWPRRCLSCHSVIFVVRRQ